MASLLVSIPSMLSLVIGISGFLFGLSGILLQTQKFYCDKENPSVSIKWDESCTARGITGDGLKRRKVLGFLGIHTGFGSAGRRRVLRQTWFPANHQQMKQLEERTGLELRFVIGKTSNSSKMVELKKEIAAHDDFLLLDIEEEYNNLPHKTLAFFKAAYALYDADFYVKLDDDIYLRPDRLSMLLLKNRSNSRTYIGCMKKGVVYTNPGHKWYEPKSQLIGQEYFVHSYGTIYALSAEIVSSLVASRNDSLRMFNNEDVTVGSWMLAMNVHHEDVRELCEADCSTTSIAVLDLNLCAGNHKVHGCKMGSGIHHENQKQ